MSWQDHLGDLCTVIRNKDADLAAEQWYTVIQLMQAAKGKMIPTISFFGSYYFLFLFFFVFFFVFVLFCFVLLLIFLKFCSREGPYAGTDC